MTQEENINNNEQPVDDHGLHDTQIGEQNDTKSTFVNELFVRISKNYDLVNDLMTFGMHKSWKQKTIDMASSHFSNLKSAKVLDLCTGTGDIAFMWSEKAKVQKIIGLDYCEPMLSQAEGKLKDKPHMISSRVDFMQGDALNLPFPDNSFDAITVGYGLRNVADLQKAIFEIKRVLKPQGIIASLDLGHPQNRIISTLYKNIFLNLIPWLGAIFSGDKAAYDYLIKSLNTWPKQRDFAQMFIDSSFSRAYYHDLMFGSVAIVVAQK